MHSSTIIIFAALLPAIAVAFVQPTNNNNLRHYRHTTNRIFATSDMSTEADIDIEHAKYCADHFGECSLDDIDHMRNALHQERITHAFTNTDGLNIEEDVEHKVLENTLSFQLGLLQDKLATEHMQEESMAAYGMSMNPQSSTLNVPVLDAGLDEESSEALVICLAIAGMTLLPQLLGN